ncbi:MAG: LysE family translocator [Hyphomicrobiaceae bacterium]|nr:LysE family translocator [Hyphomicrobiaceae bacterium]
MASWETLAAFAAVLAVFAYVPGPATLYAAAQTMARGRKAGLLAAVGLHVGGYVHVAAAAFGLSALLALVPGAYLVVKLAGALYLVWLGINILCSGRAENAPARPAADMKQRSTFSQSIVVEILNPKAAMFFLAFLPQFVDPAGALSVSTQMLVLGFVTLLAFTSADILTVLLADLVVSKLKNTGSAQRVFRWIAGCVLVGLGARLAMESQR